MFLKDRRVVLTGIAIIVLAVNFWAGSRVPALDEKAMMGGDAQLNQLGFETVLEIEPEHPWYQRTIYTTVNWIKTNQKGMTFGILFATLLMGLFTLFKRRSFQSGFSNTLLGVTIGAPLGVCVNCAAPIAQGLHSGGARAETTLAAMISSPTLNFIVLTMLFSLFPLYMVVTKLALTVGFILIAIPILSRVFAKNVAIAVDAEGAACELPLADTTGAGSWFGAVKWVVVEFVKNLWFIVRKTVPLMILAGFLGSLAITVLPWNSMADVIPFQGPIQIILTMGIIAAVGLFLPVPIAFDVLVAAILLATGMPVAYVMVLLFTLGIFSFYSFAIVWQSVGRRMAAAIVAVLFVMGVGAGAAGHKLGIWDLNRQQRLFFENFSETETPGPKFMRTDYAVDPRPAEALLAELEHNAFEPVTLRSADADGVSVSRIAFGPKGPSSQSLFTRLEGPRIGIDEPYSFSILRFVEPYNQFRGIATGDVHNDGWYDVLITSDHGLSLYANIAGNGFVRQEIRIAGLDDHYVANAALVDLNDDGWLDIFCSCYREGSYVIYNREGTFDADAIVEVPNQEGAVLAAAAGFGDVDRDGDLDAVFANWSVGPFTGGESAPLSSRNVLVENTESGFVTRPLVGLDGESLTALFSDFDLDGDLDLIVGNDFGPPDYYYLGNGEGDFTPITRSDGIIPVSTRTTMSIHTADLDNDLVPEIFLAQISGLAGRIGVEPRMVDPELCAEIEDPEDRRRCEFMMGLHQQVEKSRRDPFQCMTIEDLHYRQDCIAYRMLNSAHRNKDKSVCSLFPEAWEMFSYTCETSDVVEPVPEEAMLEVIPQNRRKNILLAASGNGDGSFVDRAAEMGLLDSGWSWNAKIADVDNDEWQDVYVATGQFMNDKRTPNLFFRNNEGKEFVEDPDAGLGSFLCTSAYSYVDIDHDGDLDIIALPVVGPVVVYTNNSSANSIAFQIRDHVGNRYGIGCKVIIHYGDGEKRSQIRELQASGGFISFDPAVAYFGLGAHNRVDRVEVLWSTGEHTDLNGGFEAGACYVIERL